MLSGLFGCDWASFEAHRSVFLVVCDCVWLVCFWLCHERLCSWVYLSVLLVMCGCVLHVFPLVLSECVNGCVRVCRCVSECILGAFRVL